eukprot:70403-Amphidinium_carterae.1
MRTRVDAGSSQGPFPCVHPFLKVVAKDEPAMPPSCLAASAASAATKHLRVVNGLHWSACVLACVFQQTFYCGVAIIVVQLVPSVRNSTLGMDLGACPVLAKLYGSQWRDFFVNGLGVPAAATTTQLLQRLEPYHVSTQDGVGREIEPFPAHLLPSPPN